MDDISKEDKVKFCATLMSAARKLGIEVAFFRKDDKYRYVWGDPACMTAIEGPLMDNNQDALFAACVALQVYFNIKSNGGKQSPSCNDNTEAGAEGNTANPR